MFDFFHGMIFLIGDNMKVITVRKLEEKKEVKLQIRKVSPTWGVILFSFIYSNTLTMHPPHFLLLSCERKGMKILNAAR